MSKNVFITGGTSGIGLALTKLYLDRGDRVGVLGRDEKKWQSLSFSNHIKCSFHLAVIENKQQVKAAMNDFVKRFGPLDIVIANAGIGNAHKTTLPDFEAAEKILNVNILGTHYTIQAAFELMHPHHRGQITLISSVAGYVGLAGNAAYCAAKSALQRMAESYAIDFDNYGISVMCVNPGFVHTPLTQKNSHRMPFIISATKAASLIAQGIDKKKNWIGFPWPLYGFMSLLSIMPSALYIWLGKLFKINLYKKH